MTRLPFIPRLPKDKKAGFTLVEALLTVVILGLVLGAMAPFIRIVHTGWNLGDRKTEIQQNARVGLEMISYRLRQAKRITGIPASGSGNFVKFRNALDDQTIIFFHNVSGSPYYIGNTGLIKVNDLVMQIISSGGAVSNALLAKSLNSFTINFKDDTGAITTLPYRVYAMDIQMNLSDPQGLIPDTMNIFSSLSVRPQVRIDKPIWATSGNNVVGLAWDDQISGFSSPSSVSVNNVLLVNGRETVWVADTNNHRICRIYWSGSEWLKEFVTGFRNPRAVSVNPAEIVSGKETCWVADGDGSKSYPYRIRRIYATGSTTWNYDTITGFNNPYSVSVNSNEILNGRNTCWVADMGGNNVRKIYWVTTGGGSYTYVNLSLGSNSAPRSVSVNTADNTCWVACSGTHPSNGNRIRKINSACTSILLTITGFNSPYSVSIDSTIGECWVADTGNNSIKKLSSGGTVLLTKTGFLSPQFVSVISTEHSCWIADTNNNQVVKLDSEGNEEFRISGFTAPLSVASVP